MPDVEDPVLVEARERAAASEAKSKAAASEPLAVKFAVLTAHRPPLRAGQVVFGTAEQVAALGDEARPATEAEISISAPSHFPLEA